MSVEYGRPFVKMTGSGNDFLFFDRLRSDESEAAMEAAEVRSLCARGTGVGADGVVLLVPSSSADFGIVYYNSDGSRAELCGNASLCTTRLAVELGVGKPEGLAFTTDAGVVRGRLVAGVPEIDLQPVTELRPDLDIPRVDGERRMGYARAGVPHVVVLCDRVEDVDVEGRGRALRWHPGFSDGANANFVGRAGEGWAMRTFERGVEGETLACGTGAVAAAVLLSAWGYSGQETTLATRAGQLLTVRAAREGAAQGVSLRGEGRIVYRAELAT